MGFAFCVLRERFQKHLSPFTDRFPQTSNSKRQTQNSKPTRVICGVRQKPLVILVRNAFRVVVLGAALLAPYFGQAAGTTDAPRLTSSTVTLGWDKSRSRGVKGYRLHCGLTSGRDYARLVTVGNVTSYTFSNLIPGKTYYCVVTAYDAAGRESPPSNEISFTVSASARTGPKPTPATQTSKGHN